jgi:hypothetical protein
MADRRHIEVEVMKMLVGSVVTGTSLVTTPYRHTLSLDIEKRVNQRVTEATVEVSLYLGEDSLQFAIPRIDAHGT